LISVDKLTHFVKYFVILRKPEIVKAKSGGLLLASHCTLREIGLGNGRCSLERRRKHNAGHFLVCLECEWSGQRGRSRYLRYKVDILLRVSLSQGVPMECGERAVKQRAGSVLQ